MAHLEKSNKPDSKKKNNKKANLDQEKKPIILDDRFKKVHFDPRFGNFSKKERKFKIDPRFGQVLSDPRFKTVGKVDKYGRKLEIPKTNKEMEEFYYMEDEEENNIEEENEKVVNIDEATLQKINQRHKKNKKENLQSEKTKANRKVKLQKQENSKPSCFTDDGRFEWNIESSDSSDIEDLELEIGKDLFKNEEDLWESEEQSIPEGDPTKRIAMVNYDWENTKAPDIMLFLSSFTPKNGYIKSVKIYPSEFGLEKLKEEEKLGPQGIWKDTKMDENLDDQIKDENNLELDADAPWIFRDEQNVDIDPVKLRKYEKDRLRYYYAVIECDSIGTAKSIYENCDGLEMELTSIKIDLRYIPNDTKFEREPKEVCTEVPATASVNCFLNRAVQHTNVKLTWDEPKANRFKELDRKEVDDYDKMDLSKYIADSDSSNDSEDQEEEITRKRDLLLGNISKDWKADFDKSKKNKKREEIIIKFNPGFDELGNRILEKTNPEKAKEKKKQARSKENKEDEEDYLLDKAPEKTREELAKEREELELLVDAKDDKKKAFRPNFKDERFRGIYEESKKFQIDPTSKHYKNEDNRKWLEAQTTGRKKVKMN